MPPRSPRTMTKYQSPYQNLPIPRHLLTETLGPKPNSRNNKQKTTDKTENSSQTSSSSDGQKSSTTGYTRDKLLGAVEKVRSGQYLLINRDSPYRHSFEGLNYHQYVFATLTLVLFPAIGGSLTKTYHPSSSQQINNHNQPVPHNRTIPHHNNVIMEQPPRPPPRKNRQIVDHSNQQSTMAQYDSPGQSSGISAEEEHRINQFDEHFQHHQSMEENISADENYEFDHKELKSAGHYHHHHQRTRSNPVAIPTLPPTRQLQSLTSQYYSYRAPKNMSITDIERRCLALRQEFLHFRQRQEQLKQQHLQSIARNEHNIVKPRYYRPISSIDNRSATIINYDDDDELNITPSSSSDGFESLC